MVLYVHLMQNTRLIVSIINLVRSSFTCRSLHTPLCSLNNWMMKATRMRREKKKEIDMTEKEKEKKCMYVIQTHSLTHSITSFAHSLKRARTHSPKRTHTLMHAYIHIHSVPLLEDGLKSVRSCV